MKRRPDVVGILAWLTIALFVAGIILVPLDLPYRLAYVGIVAPMVALVLVVGRDR